MIRSQIVGNLESYQVDPVQCFLPAEDPLECLPLSFEIWEHIAAEVPALLRAAKLRQTLEKLTPLDISRLEDERQLRRAMLLLSIFGNAYVWGGEAPATTIPQPIALPWWEVSQKLGRPPIASYASLVLDNWRRLDKSQPVALDNLAALQLIQGSLDEAWFYLTPVAIEATGGAAVVSLVKAQEAVVSDRVEVLAEQLKKIASVLADMYGILLRLPEKCDPSVYYHCVRPFYSGWPEPGVIYKGVSDTPQNFTGASAAQSSLVQSLDAGLGIKHHDERITAFLHEIRSYMPPPHRKFIEALEAGPSIRQFVLNRKQSDPALCDLYNDCIRKLNNFRKGHMRIAANYILRQNPQQAKGTSGTNFVHFLKKIEEDLVVHLIS